LIVEPVKLATPISSTSVVATVDTQARKKQRQKVTSQRLLTPIQVNQNVSVAAENVTIPPPPESLPPEFSSLTNRGNAALLGNPQSVGYRQLPPVISHVNGSFETPTAKVGSVSQEVTSNFTHTQNLLPPQSQLVAEKLVPATKQIAGEKKASADQVKISGNSADKVNISVSNSQTAANSQLVQNVLEFKSRSPTTEPAIPSSIEFTAPVTQTPPPQETPKQSPTQPSQTKLPVRERVVEVVSDRQEYDEQRRVVTAEGNVVVRFDGAIVDADRLQVNLDNLIAVGEGNVALTRGDQVLRGERFTYNLIQDNGQLENGRGEIFIPTAQTDFAFLPTDITAGSVPRFPPSDRIRANQPVSRVSSPGGIDFNLFGQSDASNIGVPKSGGEVRRLRFEAEKIDFYPRGWQARNARITNDPFSPPEFEIRAEKVTLTRQAPLIDRINTQRSRIVFDQSVKVPIPVEEQTIDRRKREVTPAIVSVGYDGDKRGGLFVERSFVPINTDSVRLRITPQFFVQKSLQAGDDFTGLFGAKAKLNATLNPQTTVEGTGELTNLDLNKKEENLRASLRLRQILGDRNPHTLNLEYSYRDRLYNGTLGYQTVQSSFGGIITSPIIPLGQSGINLSYQAGAQYIDANTDRQDLLEPVRQNDRISLGRLQGSAALNTGFLLWRGKPLPATATEGLKYTPNPVVPYLQAIAGVTGTTSYYSNGDNQSTLIGTIGLQGQIGNFSRPFLDYTAFNISYSQGINSGLSPFLFDRTVDNRLLSAGISQQIYGPLRLGLQTSVNLDTGKETSTDYILEYSRRTHSLVLRYNPVLQLGGFSIRISDFNWSGGTDPFSGDDVKPVVGGVRQ
jgi:lipopolysaccharide export system protein LptA